MGTTAENWKGSGNGLICNADPILGGIIDKAIVSGEWFAIFNSPEIEPMEGFTSREAAIEAFNTKLAEIYILD